MSSFFDTMCQALSVVERHVESHESPDVHILFTLALLLECVDSLHILDHEMKGAINRSPLLIRSFRELRSTLIEEEDNDV